MLGALATWFERQNINVQTLRMPSCQERFTTGGMIHLHESCLGSPRKNHDMDAHLQENLMIGDGCNLVLADLGSLRSVPVKEYQPCTHAYCPPEFFTSELLAFARKPSFL